MGSWFSNLHVRKNGTITGTVVAEYIQQIMASHQYLPVASKDEADGAFAIISDDRSQWYSVYSDLFSFDDPKQFTDHATPMSEKLKTDILGISCFDSDYLYLDLIDAENGIDAWVGVGSAAGLGIRRRTNLTAWKDKVDDHGSFKEHAKKEFVFAEDLLLEIQHCIHLPQEYSAASYEYLADLGLDERAMYLYFKLPGAKKIKEAPKLEQRITSLMPCYLDRPSVVQAVNVGGASKGLSVYFIGPYVEREEITFSDVCFVKFKNGRTEDISFDLKKTQLSDGRWAYYHHDPGYRILPKVDDRLPMMKRIRVESERSIIVRFVPHGDPRKILDITVVLVPDEDLQGQVGWNVWQSFGSKKEYIKYHNNSWSKRTNCEHLLLREEDFD